MICPNLSNQTVRQEFHELQSVFGESMAYLLWDRNGGYGFDKAPNGKESNLFKDLNKIFSRREAFILKAKTLSNSFLEWFGKDGNTDDNNEPRLINNKFQSGSQTKSIFNIDGTVTSNTLLDNKIAINEENHRQTNINGSMSQELLSNFENYFPDYSHYNGVQRQVVADMVEQGKLQIICTI